MAMMQNTRKHNTRKTAAFRFGLGVMTMLLPVVLFACSSSNKGATNTTTTTAPPPVSTTVAVPRYNAAKNARKTVTLTGCAYSASGWSAKGQATNMKSAAAGLSIVVDFTSTGARVIDTKIVNVPKLAPKASKAWSVSGAAPGQKKINCVIRQALYT